MNPAKGTDEVCHRVRGAGLGCWAKLGRGGLLAGEVLAFIHPPTTSKQCSAMHSWNVVVKGVSVRMLWVRREELEFQ